MDRREFLKATALIAAGTAVSASAAVMAVHGDLEPSRNQPATERSWRTRVYWGNSQDNTWELEAEGKLTPMPPVYGDPLRYGVLLTMLPGSALKPHSVFRDPWWQQCLGLPLDDSRYRTQSAMPATVFTVDGTSARVTKLGNAGLVAELGVDNLCRIYLYGTYGGA